MSHEIAVTNGRASMMFSGESPWHGLGKRLDNPPTSREAIVAAGLDYEVISVPMYANVNAITSTETRRALGDAILGRPAGLDGFDPLIPVPSHFLNVRADNAVPLGVVSDRYKVVQNWEAFEFLDSLVAEGSLRYETAGALGKGERVWMLARIPGTIVLPGDDVTAKFLLLSNSHDGGTSLRVLPTAVRVVCANTLAIALGKESAGWSFRHTGDVAAKIDEARRVLGLAVKHFDDFGSLAERFARTRVTEAQTRAFFEALYPNPKGADPAKAKATRMALFGLLDQGQGADLDSARGTAWGLLNSVTEYIDHHIPMRESGDITVAQRRLEAGTWGDGAKVKQRALSLATALAGDGAPADRAIFSAN